MRIARSTHEDDTVRREKDVTVGGSEEGPLSAVAEQVRWDALKQHHLSRDQGRAEHLWLQGGGEGAEFGVRNLDKLRING